MARKSSNSRPLTPARIVEAAIAILDAEGLDAFSLRSLGRALGVEAMSLYYWFPSRLDILNAVLDHLLSEVKVPPATVGWVDGLVRAAHELRRVVLAHPRFAVFLLTHRFNTPAALRVLEEVLALVHASGRDEEACAQLFRAWVHQVMGALLDEAAGYAEGPGATVPVSDEVLAAAYPLVHALGRFNAREHHEATFDAGVRAVLRSGA